MSIIEKAVGKLESENKATVKRSAGNQKDSPDLARYAGAVEASAKSGGTERQQPPIPQERAQQAEPPASGSDVQESGAPERTAEGKPIDIRFSELKIEGMVSLEGGRSRMEEEYRMIKRPLLVRALSTKGQSAKPPNLIMVSSALSGEGKTFTSINLAISIAMEMDKTVLLIDCDLAKPSLSRILNISERAGFTECLQDPQQDLGQFILHTDVPTLKVLSAGKRYNRSTELLASNTMLARLNELASRYPDRIVLFDSPPLLATSEASVLARHMGQVALVVEYGVTPRHLIKEAVGLLDADSQESVSLILNKTRDDFLSIGAGGYGYGYQYGYGKGYGYGSYGDR